MKADDHLQTRQIDFFTIVPNQHKLRERHIGAANAKRFAQKPLSVLGHTSRQESKTSCPPKKDAPVVVWSNRIRNSGAIAQNEMD